MTEKELEQQQEIERLQKKLRSLSEAYSHTAEELAQMKKEEKKVVRRGRPSLDRRTKARILSLYSQGRTMREIAKETKTALGTVHKVIAEASQESRTIYIYMDRNKVSTLIDTCSLTHKVKIINFTGDYISRAFGINESPDWEAFMNFLEDRCMPRTRYGIREELRHLGLDVYDPVQIVAETSGRVYGDGQWLMIMDKDWNQKYDAAMRTLNSEQDRKEKILELLREEGKEFDYQGG